MKIILIAAMADNRIIGKSGQLPWDIREDLQNFKRLTTGGVIIMGRKTYESIGRPLPNRRNIVLSSEIVQKEWIEIFHAISDIFKALTREWIEQVFLIGGQKIYEVFLNDSLVDEIWLSKIPGDYEGDASFPVFEDDFREQETEQFETFQFVKYIKR